MVDAFLQEFLCRRCSENLGVRARAAERGDLVVDQTLKCGDEPRVEHRGIGIFLGPIHCFLDGTLGAFGETALWGFSQLLADGTDGRELALGVVEMIGEGFPQVF